MTFRWNRFYIIAVKIVGITGGVGSGKSTVSRMIRERGYPVVDLDELAHQVIEPGEPAYERILSRFGTDILGADRRIDRRRLGQRVFSDPEARKELESLTHPEIFKLLWRRIEEYRSAGCPLLFLEVPLLFETGMDTWIHSVIVVKSPEEVCLRRLKERDGFSAEEACSRIRAQMSLEEKARRADFVVDNSRDLKHAQDQVEEILNKLVS